MKGEIRRRQVGRKERREERMNGRNEMCKDRLGMYFAFHKALHSMKPRAGE